MQNKKVKRKMWIKQKKNKENILLRKERKKEKQASHWGTVTVSKLVATSLRKHTWSSSHMELGYFWPFSLFQCTRPWCTSSAITQSNPVLHSNESQAQQNLFQKSEIVLAARLKDSRVQSELVLCKRCADRRKKNTLLQVSVGECWVECSLNNNLTKHPVLW